MCVWHVLSLACGQRHASPGGFSYAARAQDTARLGLVRGESAGWRGGDKRGKGEGGCARETGSKIPTCALLFHQLFVSVLCEWTSTRIQKQQQQEAGTHTHHTHTLTCATHSWTNSSWTFWAFCFGFADCGTGEKLIYNPAHRCLYMYIDMSVPAPYVCVHVCGYICYIAVPHVLFIRLSTGSFEAHTQGRQHDKLLFLWII